MYKNLKKIEGTQLGSEKSRKAESVSPFLRTENKQRSKRTKRRIDEVKNNAESKKDTAETNPRTRNSVLEKCKNCQMGVQLLSVRK